MTTLSLRNSPAIVTGHLMVGFPFYGVLENLRQRRSRSRGGSPGGSQEWRHKVAVVTGASSGIGRACALRLAEAGAQVVLASRSAQRLDELVAECLMRGGVALAIPTDVADEHQCRRLIAQTVERFGQLDLLVNNAGIAVGAMLADLPDLGLFRRVMDVNFYGQVYCAYHALPYLKQTEGRILAISSLGGKMPIPGNTSYNASKFGLHGFYDSLRMELHDSGVSITVVCPYWVVTEFHERQLNSRGEARGPLGRAIYTQRMMTADRCAQIALRAAERRRREVLMPPGLLASWIRLIAPGLLDRLTIKLFLEPALRRVQAARGGQT